MSKISFGLRMPPDVKQWTSRRAEEEGRSINNMIVRILRDEMERARRDARSGFPHSDEGVAP